jgi:hypothetical protein
VGGGATDVEFGKLLSWAYRGEVSGEALFARLATHFEPMGREAQFRRLAELERAMGDAVRPLLEEHEVDAGDLERSNADALAAADELGRQPFEHFVALFEPVTADALDRYHRLAALGGEEDRAVFELLIAHEEALREYGRREQAGDSERSLELVDVVLDRLRQHASDRTAP